VVDIVIDARSEIIVIIMHIFVRFAVTKVFGLFVKSFKRLNVVFDFALTINCFFIVQFGGNFGQSKDPTLPSYGTTTADTPADSLP